MLRFDVYKKFPIKQDIYAVEDENSYLISDSGHLYWCQGVGRTKLWLSKKVE
jgi:hypothetical protein